MDSPVVVSLDLETTGPDPESDWIVQIGLGVGPFVPGGKPKGGAILVNPGKPISPEATEVHGITDEDVAEAVTFGHIASRVQGVLAENEYLLTYSGRTFDVPILDRELKRYGFPGVEAAGIREIDLYEVWKALEPRNLATAAKRFGGDPDFDAHDAWEDARILFSILQGMDTAFMDRDTDGADSALEEFAGLTTPEDAVDRYGYFRRREDGVVVFDFSDHRGEPVHEKPGMVEWMLGRDFPEEVLTIAQQQLEVDHA